MKSRSSDPRDLSDERVDYLLSRGNLGGTQRDRIFAAISATVQVQNEELRVANSTVPRRSPRWFWIFGLGATAGATLALFIYAATSAPSFRAKGRRSAMPVEIDVACVRGSLQACRPGSLLAFSILGSSQEVFINAALRADDGHLDLWLLRDEAFSAPESSNALVHPQAARLPDDQAAGRYSIEILATRRPLVRLDEHTFVSPPERILGRSTFEVIIPP